MTSNRFSTRSMNELPLRKQIFEHLAVLRIPLSDRGNSTRSWRRRRRSRFLTWSFWRDSCRDLPTSGVSEAPSDGSIKPKFPTAATLESFDWDVQSKNDSSCCRLSNWPPVTSWSVKKTWPLSEPVEPARVISFRGLAVLAVCWAIGC